MSRIIAGSRGGRRLDMPPGAGTRPTTDRVREALFSTLASWAGTAAGGAVNSLTGLAFADLYAGSGAVGLEAASRGAGPVWLVEAHGRTARIAARNAAALDLPVLVRTGTVEELARTPAELSFDVMFADPPYESNNSRLAAVLADLVEHGWVNRNGLLVVERSRRTGDLTWPEPYALAFRRSYGETILHFAGATDPASPSKEPVESREVGRDRLG